MRKLSMVVGLAVGYVLGTKAGRERYQQMTDAAKRLMERPEVKRATERVSSQAADKLRAVREPGKTAGGETPAQQPPAVPDAPETSPEPTVVSSLDTVAVPPEPTPRPPGDATPPLSDQ